MPAVTAKCFVCWYLLVLGGGWWRDAGSVTAAAVPLFTGQASTPRPPLGTVLPAVYGYNSSCPWVNLMFCSPPLLITTKATSGWMNPASVAYDPVTGFPRNMTAAMQAHTVVLSGLDGHYDAGTYDLEFDGNGTVTVGGDASGSNSGDHALPSSTNGTLTFVVTTPTNRGIVIFLNDSSAANPVTRITLQHRATAAAATTRWNPAWLRLLQNFSFVRVSHWQQEQYNAFTAVVPRNWSDRTAEQRATQVSSDGVSHEHIAQLAMDAGVDLVLSVPQSATEDYMHGMASLYAATGRRVFLVDSFMNGYSANPIARVHRLDAISSVFRSVFAANGAAHLLQILVMIDVLSDEWLQYFTPSHAWYNATFIAQVDAVGVSGDIIVGSEPWSSVTPNPYFTSLLPYLNDSRRIAWERMISTEGDFYAYVGKWSVVGMPVYVLDGGLTFATDMFGARFSNASSVEARIQGQLERNLWDYELANPVAMETLWAEWLERMYRVGVKMISAGMFVHKGIECVWQNTGFSNANRYQCYYRGLCRFVDTCETEHKYRGVMWWKRNDTVVLPVSLSPGEESSGPMTITQLVDAPPQPSAPVCTSPCVWGTCDEEGRCVCHNGYQGAACDVFNATLLPNGCSSEGYGANLGGGADWEPSWIWTDFMNFARLWIHQPISAYVWSFDPAQVQYPTLTSDGYPASLGPDHAMSTFLRRDTYEYPHGIFHFFYEGEGTITFGMDTHLVRYVRNGYYLLRTAPRRQLNNGLWFQIRRTNPDNPVRNVHVVPDAQLHRFRWMQFHPLYLQSLQRYRVLRFMPLQNVALGFNGSTTEEGNRTWADRTLPTYFSQTAGRDAISYENIIALANQLHIRPWICIPYNADDGYVSNLTALLKATLNPKLTPIVEYSNEVWSNTPAGNHAQRQAILNGLDSGSWVVRARACWNQHRARQIWRLMRDAGLNVTRVLGAQAAYSGPAEEALRCDPGAAAEIDAIGVAPFFGVPITTGATLDQNFFQAGQIINGSAQQVAVHVALAARYNISTVFTYEAGPGFFGGATAESPEIVALGRQIHRDPRMAAMVRDYFHALVSAGSTVNNYFAAPAGRWGVYGSWGIREYQNQDPAQTPKLAGYEAFGTDTATAVTTACVSLAPAADSANQCNCSGHGFCVSSSSGFYCECFFGFRGDNCSEFWTIPDDNYCNTYLCPLSGGTCQPTVRDGNYDIYTCVGCPSANWTGYMCQVPICPQNCSYQGLCVSPQLCSCFRGFRGPACEEDCRCGGHGVCANTTASAATCVCDAGYQWNGTTCAPSCACSVCQGPNLCGCNVACLYGACYNGTCRCWAGFGGDTCAVLAGNRSVNSESVMGINVAGIADWTSSVEFLNLMWRSRAWFLRPAGIAAPATVWSVNEPLALTVDGYPAHIPYDRVVSTFVTRDTTYIPAGVYTVLWDGKGIIDCGFDATVIPATRSVGFMQVQYTPTTQLDNGFLINVWYTDPLDPIRNIRVYSPEYPHDGVAKSLVFHPAFLQDIQPFRTVRFMDWANLGNVYDGVPMGTHQRNWSARNGIDSASMATGYGVSEEIMVSLANWLNVEPWFSIPHDTTDEYVTNFATMLLYRLRPDVAIHVEHSNEVWNSEFESHKFAVAKGRIQFPNATSDFERAIRWHGYRSQQIFDVFARVFGTVQRNRLRFKVGTFLLSTSATQLAMEYVTTRPVFLSVTGYFCDESLYGGAAAAQVLTVDELVTRCLAASTVNDTYIENQIAVANSLGASVDLYENGPGLVEMSAIFGGYSAPGVAELFRRFHLDDRQETIVQNFFTMQRSLGVDQFNYFTSAAKSSIYGNWGIKESTMQACTTSAKCRGTLAWLAANKDPKVRTVRWGLFEFGFNNVVQATFAAVPTATEIATLVNALEEAMNLTAGSVVAQVLNSGNSSSTAARPLSASSHRFHTQSSSTGNATVAFIVTVAQASSVNVSQVATTLSNSVTTVAATSVGLTVASSAVVQSATPITPTASLSTFIAASPPPPPTPPTPTSPSPSPSNSAASSTNVGTVVGAVVGSVAGVALCAALVHLAWSRSQQPAAADSALPTVVAK